MLERTTIIIIFLVLHIIMCECVLIYCQYWVCRDLLLRRIKSYWTKWPIGVRSFPVTMRIYAFAWVNNYRHNPNYPFYCSGYGNSRVKTTWTHKQSATTTQCQSIEFGRTKCFIRKFQSEPATVEDEYCILTWCSMFVQANAKRMRVM